VEISSNHKTRLIYDGVCNLCVGAVRFLNAIDRRQVVEYAPYQSLDPKVRRRYAATDRDLQGRMHIIQRNGSILKGADAIGELCQLLAPFRLVCSFFNTPFAERLYDFIAQRRYGFFGCRGSCYVPDAKKNSP